MIKQSRWMMLATLLALGGCVSASVTKGAVIGAGTGALLGAGLGAVVSDKDLLGSASSRDRGNVSLDTGTSVAAGLVVGAVFGGIVGAMIGHSAADAEKPAAPGAQAAAAKPSAF